MQSSGYIEDEVEDVELQDLQGIQGLRALRITVSPNEGKAKDPEVPANVESAIREMSQDLID